MAYRGGDLSTVYPVARGSAALLGALLGLGVLGERLSAPQLTGVALLLAGTLAAAIPGAARRSLRPALAIGGLIAAYTFLDRLGARTGPAWLYGWLIFAGGSVMLAVVLAHGAEEHRRSPARPRERRAILAGGVLSDQGSS